MQRCGWCGSEPLYISYHDKEWGVPIYDELKLFELLLLETMQTGLSWITILRKRESLRLAFDQFNPEKIAGYSDQKLNELLNDPGIIRHRLKISATVKNAKAFLAIQERGSFTDYIWQFTEGKSIQNHWQTLSQVPAKTNLSDAMAKDLKKRNFSFVGSTVCYAYMQATGMVNDHLTDCFRYAELA